MNKISIKNSTLLNHFILKSKNENDDNFKIIKYIVNSNININEPYNLPPLINSVKNNKYFIVNLLLQYKNLDINITDSYGSTAIFYATKNNNIKLIDLLIKYKININFFSKFNNFQYLNYVIALKNDVLLNFILDNNINCNLIDINLNLPINNAIKLKYNPDIIKKLILKTKNLNFQNIEGKTPLYYLVKNYDWNLFSDLLEKKN